ncbi:hypothetical protein SLEP1_g1568 [Rubroshorea leprosula]|uniref:Uncharacterized protein n=1 Tax=Rubroshorea leprosula TaxID=152421 RepID=A0AAV5HNB2_9ROSI|nr:hypothetical protein SLEP1_g1568 [Rubroshorea leprosula]
MKKDQKAGAEMKKVITPVRGGMVFVQAECPIVEASEADQKVITKKDTLPERTPATPCQDCPLKKEQKASAEMKKDQKAGAEMKKVITPVRGGMVTLCLNEHHAPSYRCDDLLHLGAGLLVLLHLRISAVPLTRLVVLLLLGGWTQNTADYKSSTRQSIHGGLGGLRREMQKEEKFEKNEGMLGEGRG